MPCWNCWVWCQDVGENTCFQLSISYPRHFCESSFSPTIIDKFRESIKKNCLGSLTDVPRVCAFGRGNTSSGAVPCDQTAETKAFSSWGGSVNVSKAHVVSCAASEQSAHKVLADFVIPFKTLLSGSTFGSAEAAWPACLFHALQVQLYQVQLSMEGLWTAVVLWFQCCWGFGKQFGLGCFKAVSLAEKPSAFEFPLQKGVTCVLYRMVSGADI